MTQFSPTIAGGSLKLFNVSDVKEVAKRATSSGCKYFDECWHQLSFSVSKGRFTVSVMKYNAFFVVANSSCKNGKL